MRRLLIGLAVVLAVLTAAWFGDGAVRRFVEQQVVQFVTEDFGGSGVQVNLGGFPFSTALLTKTVPTASVSADSLDLGIQDKTVKLTKVVVGGDQVQVADGWLRAEQVEGRADLGFDQLRALSGLDFYYVDPGRVGLRQPFTVFGQDLEVVIVARPVLDETTGALNLTDVSVEWADVGFSLPIDQRLLDNILQPIDLALPYGLRMTQLTATETGLTVGLAAADFAVATR